jgi:N-acetyl-gamma-glutamyl-phosphate reductase
MRVAVVGASGYTGLELLRLLVRHPELEIVALTSERQAGTLLGDVYPAFRGVLDQRFEAVDAAAIAARAEFAFAALPHTASAPVVRELVQAGVAVVDLSADFRLRNAETYAAWYGEHRAPELLGKSVYGIPELHRAAIREAQLVAAPGCYPTSVLLPLAPFLRAGLVDPGSILVDSKSGVSGAGRKAQEAFLFAEIGENCRAYDVGGAHRHVPEIEEQAGLLAGGEARVAFVPHLLPATRGIATSIFLRPSKSLSTVEARAVLEEAYADEFFVRVLPEGETPSLAAVRGSNFCDVTAVVDERTGALLLLSSLDNLVKGAGGQGVQCCNLMQGWDEALGLREAPFLP